MRDIFKIAMQVLCVDVCNICLILVKSRLFIVDLHRIILFVCKKYGPDCRVGNFTQRAFGKNFGLQNYIQKILMTIF